MSKENTPIGELIKIIDDMAVVKGTPESTISILRNVTAHIRGKAVKLLPKEREAIKDAYNEGSIKGYEICNSEHCLRSNFKVDKFRVNIFSKQYYNDKYGK